MSLYEGLLKILNLEGGFKERAYSVRLEEQDILDVSFLARGAGGTSAPTLAVLFRAGDDRLRVSAYDVSLRERTLVGRPWAGGGAVHEGAAMILPLSEPQGALLVLGGDRVTVVSSRGSETVPCPLMVPRCATPLAPPLHPASSGGGANRVSRFLVGDASGALFVVSVEADALEALGVGRVAVLRVETAGDSAPTVIPSTLATLGGSSGDSSFFAFIGSAFGDSQLCRVQLLQPAAAASGSGSGGGAGAVALELERFASLGPIVDFDLVSEGGGSAAAAAGGRERAPHGGGSMLVAACGGYKEGSLRVVRAGIGIQEHASVDLAGITGLWSLRAGTHDAHASFLLQSYATESRLFGVQARAARGGDGACDAAPYAPPHAHTAAGRVSRGARGGLGGRRGAAAGGAPHAARRQPGRGLRRAGVRFDDGGHG